MDIANLMTGDTLRPSPRKLWCHLKHFVAGFSCKSVSSLNSNRVQRSHNAIFDEMCSTGSTLRGVFDFMEKCSPSTALLENVLGLRKGWQTDAISDRLWQLGYYSLWLDEDPTRYGHPQRRPRLPNAHLQVVSDKFMVIST